VTTERRSGRRGSNADDLARAGEESFSAGRLGEASGAFSAALSRSPDHAASLVGLARIAIALDRLDEAAALLDSAPEAVRDEPRLLFYRGVVAESKGDADAAVVLYGRAAGRDPGFVAARFHLGRALGALGRNDEAARELERALAARPDAPDILYALAIVEQERGRPGAAAAALGRAIGANPAFLDAYLTLADILVAEGRPDAAERVAERAAKLFPRAGAPLDKLAAIAVRAGEVRKAVRALVRQVEVEPENAIALRNLSTFAQAAGDLETAARAAERLVALAPGHWEGYHHLGSILEAAGRLERAKAALRRAVDLGRGEWRPRNDLALLMLSGDPAPGAFDEAVRLLDEAAALAPPDEAAPHVNLALAALQAGDRRGAESRAREALSRSRPGGRVHAQAREILAVAR